MPLDAREKERARYHLGYLAVQPAASIQFGIPRPIQTMFLVETALENIIEEAVDRVRKILKIMDDTEMRLVESQDRLAASALDALKLRENEPDLLEREYVRWGWRLADVLGVPIYPYSNRYRMGAGTRAGSIPVR
jgi:hypothetical protein